MQNELQQGEFFETSSRDSRHCVTLQSAGRVAGDDIPTLHPRGVSHFLLVFQQLPHHPCQKRTEKTANAKGGSRETTT